MLGKTLKVILHFMPVKFFDKQEHFLKTSNNKYWCYRKHLTETKFDQ